MTAKAISLAIFLATVTASGFAQKQGKWLDTSKDIDARFIVYGSEQKPILAEDYEVVATHEICASVNGYFLQKSQLGRYDVNFRGMRTSATFVFTTQYDAEKWAEKFCTAGSLTNIKAGRSVFARNY